jgi:chaperonin GroES
MVDTSKDWAAADPDQIKLGSNPSKIKPMGNQVVVKLDPLPEMSESGLLHLATDSRDHEHRIGTVMAVGPGWIAPKTGIRCPMELVVGDRVLIGRYVGAQFTFEGETFQIMPEEQIYCAIEEK